MHDPCTLAFEIFLGRKQKKNGNYRTPFITIWHKDPEKDGTDDSCGWFIRARHVDPEIIRLVKREFEFNFKHNYWFNSKGDPKFSTLGIALNMYTLASWQICMYLHNNQPSNAARRDHKRFMKKYLYDIMWFAENPTDSLHDAIHLTFGYEPEEARINHFTNIIVADIMRKRQKWYQHPRWHIHHWEITFPWFRSLYRRYIERCDRCRKRFKTQSVYTDWNGTEHWCEKCNGSSTSVAQ